MRKRTITWQSKQKWWWNIKLLIKFCLMLELNDTLIAKCAYIHKYLSSLNALENWYHLRCFMGAGIAKRVFYLWNPTQCWTCTRLNFLGNIWLQLSSWPWEWNNCEFYHQKGNENKTSKCWSMIMWWRRGAFFILGFLFVCFHQFKLKNVHGMCARLCVFEGCGATRADSNASGVWTVCRETRVWAWCLC